MPDQPVWPGRPALTAAQVTNAADKSSGATQAFAGAVSSTQGLSSSQSVAAYGLTYIGYDFIAGAYGSAISLSLDTVIARTAAGVATVKNQLAVVQGAGVWGHAPPAAQPAAPVTLADVIAIIRACGLSA